VNIRFASLVGMNDQVDHLYPAYEFPATSARRTRARARQGV
jgi:hypothetical protein